MLKHAKEKIKDIQINCRLKQETEFILDLISQILEAYDKKGELTGGEKHFIAMKEKQLDYILEPIIKKLERKTKNPLYGMLTNTEEEVLRRAGRIK